MSKQRRESAFALVQRLKASPVGLLPPIFQNATDGGLRQSDVLVVGGVPGTGKTTWAYRVAAQHLSCGGVVTFVFLPGSGNFQMRRFMEYLETFAVTPDLFTPSSSCQYLPQVADASAMEMRRKALLSALDRLEAVHCLDINDFFVYCNHAVATAAASSAGTQEVAVPLLLVEGCGGKGSYLYHMERAVGHEVPLCHWLLDCLQRQRRCALILIEEWGCESAGLSRPRVYSREEDSSPFALAVEEESDFLHRLRKETSQRKAVLRQHSAKRQRVSSATAMTNNTATTTTSTSNGVTAPPPVPLPSNFVTELHSHFGGSRRLFYIYTETLPIAARGVSAVARLLQWRLTEQGTRNENNNNAAVPTEPIRQQRWSQLAEGRTRLCGEVLCVVQL
ncbi:hypothetical protein TRSC58_03115 [Trypanosoma rangeli SC58]|uniref:Uncharacterized protein n=1 Tax=Trypanosoma rangeli SC58 TaxID=429131 RepID=A0A061J2P5_TRYRA|nr:hypothetical protein TRSC58_03115 [Trypanosoma rangeli SC58]